MRVDAGGHGLREMRVIFRKRWHPWHFKL